MSIKARSTLAWLARSACAGAAAASAASTWACERSAAGLPQLEQSPARPPPATSTFSLHPASLRTRPLAGEPAFAGAAAVSRASLPAPFTPTPSSGKASPSCVQGWITPARGSVLRKQALDMMRTRAGERFVVEHMRYFKGPEDAEVLNPHGEVERWYVKGYAQGSPGQRRRWLVRRAQLGSGVDATAAYDSAGYGPQTWRRVGTPDPDLADPFQQPCGGDKVQCMGLPREVLGCLDGT
jgi:hypothetical protein